MKLLKNIYVALAFILVATSCNGLLDIKPVNTMIPTTVKDFEAVLLGGYPTQEFFMNTEFMTDNVYANGQSMQTLSAQYVPWFTWAGSHQLAGTTSDPYWKQLYRSIFYCNSIIDEFAKRVPVPEDAELFETVLGEAYALRAFSYFYLANLYADIYSAENLKKPCVPMPLTAVDVSQNTQNNVRETIETVWDQIVKDLEVATGKLNGKPHKTEFRFDYFSTKLFKARVHLFMGNYNAAIADASEVCAMKKPWDMNNLQVLIDAEGNKIFSDARGMIDTDYKSEVLFTLGGGTSGAGGNPFYWWQTLVKPSPQLLSLYTANASQKDYRRYIFESFADLTDSEGKKVGPTMYYMYSWQPSSGIKAYYIGLKASEALLIRAEAYARLGDKDNMAIADLNTLLKCRIKTEDFVSLQVADFTHAQLLEKVLLERRKETAFDGGLRWFDLRRLGKPAITHEFISNNVATNYTLNQGDLRYVLQIPLSEIINSPDMEQNPR